MAARQRKIQYNRRLLCEPLEDRRLLAMTPFPLPLAGADPLGSLIYDGAASGGIATAGEVEVEVEHAARCGYQMLALPARRLEQHLAAAARYADAAGASARHGHRHLEPVVVGSDLEGAQAAPAMAAYGPPEPESGRRIKNYPHLFP